MQPCIKIPLKVSNFRSADQEQNEDFDPEEAAKNGLFNDLIKKKILIFMKQIFSKKFWESKMIVLQ